MTGTHSHFQAPPIVTLMSAITGPFTLLFLLITVGSINDQDVCLLLIGCRWEVHSQEAHQDV